MLFVSNRMTRERPERFHKFIEMCIIVLKYFIWKKLEKLLGKKIMKKLKLCFSTGLTFFTCLFRSNLVQ